MWTLRATLKNSKAAERFYVFFFEIMTRVSPVASARFRYRLTKGRRHDMHAPKTFDEKLTFLKVQVYNYSQLVKQCADKLEVRKYVEGIGCAEILNPLYAVLSGPHELQSIALPERFALKWSVGAGGNVFCSDRSEFDLDQVMTDPSFRTKAPSEFAAELQFRESKPQLLCEALIETETGNFPLDYKFFCYEGEPKFVQVSEVSNGGRRHYYYRLPGWDRLTGIRTSEAPNHLVVPRPPQLEDAIHYAKRLSAPFPFVRVDLYLEKGGVTFGELTFTPTGTTNRALTAKGDRLLGEPLKWLFERVEPKETTSRKS